MNLIFFGSFQHYSALILDSLIRANHDSPLHITAVITTPPTSEGDNSSANQQTKNPVHALADQHHLPVFTPDKINPNNQIPRNKKVPSSKFQVQNQHIGNWLLDLGISTTPDYFVVAGYGKILPESWLNYPKLGCLNLHFSLLPKYRGANPAEWAIMCGETVTGISLIKMTGKLDAGDILAQAEIPIDPADTRETLYQKLYSLGAEMLPQWLQQVAANSIFSTQGSEGSRVLQNAIAKPIKQPLKSPTPYAALLKRDDGFLPWPTIQKHLQGQSLQITDFPSPHLQSAANFSLATNHRPLTTFLSSLPRALAGYPSLWTIVPTIRGDKRMKILSFQSLGTKHQALNTVQIEGQQPALFNQIKNQII